MKIILLANWGLGLEILKVLHHLSGIEIALVVTRCIKESHDKWKNVVCEFSCKHEYKVICQEHISFSELKDEIEQSEIDLLISHSFMKILPKEVFSAPKYGSINIHPSLLPKYRGPSPTYWVLKNKESITGLTCHYINEGVDTGDIIFQVKIPVKSDDEIDSIIERQKKVVKELMVESLSRIKDMNVHAVPQLSELAIYAPRPEKSRLHGKI